MVRVHLGGHCVIITLLIDKIKNVMKIFDNVVCKLSVKPQLVPTGAVSGSAVSIFGFLSGMAQIDVGAVTGTPTSFAVAGKVQESNDGLTSWTDIEGASITSITAINKSAQIRLALRKSATAKKYVRLVITPTFVDGTSPKVNIAGFIVMGEPENSADMQKNSGTPA